MSQEIAIFATNARMVGPNMTYVREETITVSEPLTDAERLEYGQEMADALAKIEEYEAALDAERKHYKSSKRRRKSPKPPQNATATARKNGRFTAIS